MNALIDALRFSKDIKLVIRPATSSFSKLYPTIHTNKVIKVLLILMNQKHISNNIKFLSRKIRLFKVHLTKGPLIFIR